MNIFLIFIGAGLGGVLRYLASNGAYSLFGRNFPYGTLLVNITGSFLMGLFFILLLEKIGRVAPQLRAFLLIGVLGGYTTFSSFSIETFNLFETGAFSVAFINIFLSILLCLLATWGGIILGRHLC